MQADLVLTHGKIYTVDPACPWAEAAAVVGERIVAAGSARDLDAWIGPGTQVLDLQGRLVLPGFTDSHVHFIQGGRALLSLKVRDADSREAFTARIAARAKEMPEGQWIITQGTWDLQRFPGVERPRRDWIDPVTPGHPVCASILDNHMILCNSLALRLAGIGRDTPAPAGGEIVRDPVSGEPTGLLMDAAMALVRAVIPPPGPAQLRQEAEAALKAAAAKGVTTVHDVSGEAGFATYQDLLQEGRLTTRITMYMPITAVEDVGRVHLRSGFGSTRLRFAGLKGFSDGALGSGMALFFEPYSDEPGKLGAYHHHMLPEGIMRKRIQAADAGGINVAVHAIGDRAIAEILDILQEVARENGPRDRRFRIEHTQHLRPSDLARLVREQVIASVQPSHVIDDGQWAERRVGPERASWSFPYRSFLEAGVPMAFGSDWPMYPMDPILAIYAAVTRRTLDGRHPEGWIPGQKIPLEAAIHATTMGAAYAECAEREKGSVTPGKLADFVVLDRNLFELPPEEIVTAQVVTTICAGEAVYRK